MHIHIMGICGTLMGGIALLARSLGHRISGSDTHVYPPMSTQLEQYGIQLQEGYDQKHLQPAPDLIIIGNAMSRGNPVVEYILNCRLPYISGPQWLSECLLGTKHVLAVAGTHGKTTTSSILCWILESMQLQPSFLIGGIPQNFGVSARLSEGQYFVIEADEYDTAFFDKRAKFVHYQPQTLIINNIEYDHADIFTDIEAIKREFHHLVRIVPGQGLIIAKHGDAHIEQVLSKGCWSSVEYFSAAQAAWTIKAEANDFSQFNIRHNDDIVGTVQWDIIGRHNAENALAAIIAAQHIGIEAYQACQTLKSFKSVKRRLEWLAEIGNITVYDDFAHHPTAIRLTLEALRQKIGRKQRIIAVMEPCSNTMRQGIHQDTLADACMEADIIFFYQPTKLSWDLQKSTESLGRKCRIVENIDKIIAEVVNVSSAGDNILIMSNRSFGGIQHKLIAAMKE